MISFILSLVLQTMPASAQESVCYNYDVLNTHPKDTRVGLVIKCKRDGSNFYLDGAVDENLIYEIKNYAQPPIETLYLNSGGGQVVEAFKVATFIRSQGIKTILRPGAVCLSACTLLFQAGQERWATPKSRLMFHGVRDPFLSKTRIKEIQECMEKPNPSCLEPISKRQQELLELTEQLFDFYEEYGASPLLADTFWSLEEDPEWWLQGNYIKIVDLEMTGKEALDLNIATHLFRADDTDRVVSMQTFEMVGLDLKTL